VKLPNCDLTQSFEYAGQLCCCDPLYTYVFLYGALFEQMLICLKSNKVQHDYTYAYCPSVPILINVSYVLQPHNSSLFWSNPHARQMYHLSEIGCNKHVLSHQFPFGEPRHGLLFHSNFFREKLGPFREKAKESLQNDGNKHHLSDTLSFFWLDVSRIVGDPLGKL